MLLSPVGGACGVKNRGAVAGKETGTGGGARGGMTGLNAISTGVEQRGEPDGQPLRGAAAGCYGAALVGVRAEEPHVYAAHTGGAEGIVETHLRGTRVRKAVMAEHPHANGAVGGGASDDAEAARRGCGPGGGGAGDGDSLP